MTTASDSSVLRATRLLEEIVMAAEELFNAGPREGGHVGFEKVARSAAILDGAIAISVLSRSPGQWHVATIARSLMELVGDLYWLCHDASYVQRLKLTASLHVRRDATDFLRLHGRDPQFERNVAQQREMARREKEAIRALLMERPGLKELRIGERLAAPGLPPIVEYVYGVFCKDAHHDAFAIQQRMDSSGAVRIGLGMPVNHLMRTIAFAGLLVVVAMERFPSFVTVLPEVVNSKLRYAQGLNQALGALWNVGSTTPSSVPASFAGANE